MPSRPLRAAIAAIYFLTCCYLFFLPGNDLPKEDWLDRIYFDKWVHVGLFTVLAFLLCWAGLAAGRKQVLWVGVLCVGYGMAVEVIQGLWVANRSADVFDLLSDSIGVLVGLWLWRRWGKKSKPL
ncbi:MAG: VanZ family protein [Chitinophagaceae bacterium]|nr:MAG: VanZ family protein [Chitinophagaceae bacterium]